MKHSTSVECFFYSLSYDRNMTFDNDLGNRSEGTNN